MKTYPASLPLIGLISGTRAMAAGGLALLLADKLDVKQRKAVGWRSGGMLMRVAGVPFGGALERVERRALPLG
jgi:hypothetical protein